MAEQTNKLEDIRSELIKVANVSPYGSHRKVAKKVGISVDYLNQIRVARNATTDNAKNRKLLSDILLEYKKIIKAKREELNAI